MNETRLKIDGLHCDGCARSVSEALLALPGVESAEVSYSAGTAAIRHDVARAPDAVLRAAIEEAGFDIRG